MILVVVAVVVGGGGIVTAVVVGRDMFNIDIGRVTGSTQRRGILANNIRLEVINQVFVMHYYGRRGATRALYPHSTLTGVL